jgi:LEA14-like dessication related protein
MLDSLKMKAVVAVLGVIGVGSVAFASGVVQVPQAGLADKGDWGQVTEDSINITSIGYIHNPNSFEVNLSSLDVTYRLKMNGISLAEGGKNGLAIEKETNQSISVDTRLKPGKVPQWWAAHLRSGEESRLKVPLNVELKVFSFPLKLSGYSYTDTIRTDLESKMDKAVSQLEGSYSWSLTDAGFTETSIEVMDGSAKFGKVTSEATNLIVDLKVHNPNDHAIPVPQFNGNLEMNDVTVAEWQANEVTVTNAPSSGKIDAGETREVKLKVEMSNEKIDEWFVSHAANRESTEGAVNIFLGFEIAGQTLTLPRDGIDCGFSFQTGILVDNQSSSSSFSGCSYPGIGSEVRGDDQEDSGILEENPLNNSEGSENKSDSSSSGLESIL